MDKKTYIATIVMLSVVLLITLGGWLQARNRLVEIRVNDYGQYEESFDVCEDVTTQEAYDACLKTLKNFGATLKKYERLLKRMQVAEQVKQIADDAKSAFINSATSSATTTQ